ncbi:hypothetical protein OH492_12475 [Vibrio chagasii]|nr:hypothetical protein [Vibrio chagasii]
MLLEAISVSDSNGVNWLRYSGPFRRCREYPTIHSLSISLLGTTPLGKVKSPLCFQEMLPAHAYALPDFRHHP